MTSLPSDAASAEPSDASAGVPGAPASAGVPAAPASARVPDAAGSAGVPDAPGAAPRTRVRIFAATAVIAIAADLISKTLVVANIKPTDAGVRLLGGAIYLVQARNSGAAFSVGTGATVLLTAISVIVAVVIARAARRLTSTPWAIALGLVLGGAVGNLIDRFFRAPSPGKGHVVDWISLFANDGHIWPIFNLADSSIVVGGITAVVLSLLGVDFRGDRNSGKKPHA